MFQIVLYVVSIFVCVAALAYIDITSGERKRVSLALLVVELVGPRYMRSSFFSRPPA